MAADPNRDRGLVKGLGDKVRKIIPHFGSGSNTARGKSSSPPIIISDSESEDNEPVLARKGNKTKVVLSSDEEEEEEPGADEDEWEEDDEDEDESEQDEPLSQSSPPPTRFIGGFKGQVGIDPPQDPIAMPVPEAAPPQNQKAHIPGPWSAPPNNAPKMLNKPPVPVPIPKDPMPWELTYDPPRGAQSTVSAPGPSTAKLPAKEDDQGEIFDIPAPNTDANWFIPQQSLKSAAEVQAEWTEIIQSLKNDASEIGPIDEEDQIVQGFADGIRLKPWQVHGRFWMKEREEGKKRGGILADDMGLGKTIQVITRITEGKRTAEEKAKGYSRPTLIIVGLTILPQWSEECHKFSPGLKVVVHHGAGRTRNQEDLERADVVLTTYDVVANEWAARGGTVDEKPSAKKAKVPKAPDDDSDSDGFGGDLKKRKEALLAATKGSKSKKAAKPQDALFQVNFLRVVVDEAQNIKGRKTKRSLACSALRSKYRWVLTGTPIQNNVEELYSLFRFLNIRPLNDWHEFDDKINKPLKRGASAAPMKRLQVILKTIMLRRLKADIHELNLPKRIVKEVQCEFENIERGTYESLATRVEKSLNRAAQDNNVILGLVLLLRLRQACNHPSLTISGELKDGMLETPPKNSADVSVAGDDDMDELATLMQGMAVKSLCATCQQLLKPGEETHCRTCRGEFVSVVQKAMSEDGAIYRSAKIRKILELLASIKRHEGGVQKTIIFSQFVKMIDLISHVFKETGIVHVRYDGSMRPHDREKALSDIQKRPEIRVILISTKAGNSGLNLTCCNNVILVDPWWNPAVEEQAFDRAHRIGQTRDVNIYKLVVPDTVEDRILMLQEKKRALAKAALEGGSLAKGNKLDMRELMDLFTRRDHDERETGHRN